jgi:uncharacterized protein involved in exopolysaccharide biosynthesis
MAASLSSSSAPFPYQAPPGDLTIGQVLSALRASLRPLLWAMLLAIVASFIFVNVVSPRYLAETRLLLESGESFFTRPMQERDAATALIDEQAVASQVQVVMSRDIAREAIRRLQLVGNEEFDPMVDGLSFWRQILIMLNLMYNPLERPPEERVIDNYYEHLLVYPVGRSRIIAIEFRSKDPDLAARAANTIAELYISVLESAKKDTARSASAWLGAAIEDLRGKVTTAEARVEEFRSSAGLLQAGITSGNVNSQQLSELSGQLSQARSAQADSQAKARLIRDAIKAGRAFEIPDVSNNELIRRLIEQRITLKAQLALESRTLLPAHPRIKELNAQLSDLEAQMRAASERIVRTLENDARIAGSRVEALSSAVDSQKSVVSQGNENEVQLRALEREAKSKREQLESYLVRYREAVAREAEKATPADARLVSRAMVPSIPVFPKKIPLILLSTVATAMLGIGFVVAKELLLAGSAAALAPQASVAPTATPVWSQTSYGYFSGPSVPVARGPVSSAPVTPAPTTTASMTSEPVAHELKETKLSAAASHLVTEQTEGVAQSENLTQGMEALIAARLLAGRQAMAPQESDILERSENSSASALRDPLVLKDPLERASPEPDTFSAQARQKPARSVRNSRSMTAFEALIKPAVSEFGTPGIEHDKAQELSLRAKKNSQTIMTAKPAASQPSPGETSLIRQGPQPVSAVQPKQDFSQLIARLSRIPTQQGGRCIGVLNLSPRTTAEIFAHALGQECSRKSKVLLVSLTPSDGEDEAGFSDLLKGDVDLATVIAGQDGKLHSFSVGRESNIATQLAGSGTESMLAALRRQYDMLFFALHEEADGVLLSALVPFIDNVLLVADLQVSEEIVISAYQNVMTHKARDIVVARNEV